MKKALFFHPIPNLSCFTHHHHRRCAVENLLFLRNYATANKLNNADHTIAQLKLKPAIFDPNTAAFWKHGEPVPFLLLARVFTEIGNETSRNSITDIVCNTLRLVKTTTPTDFNPVLYLLGIKISPFHQKLNLGIGESSVVKALAETYRVTESQIRLENQKLGDLGLVAATKTIPLCSSSPEPPPPLMALEVFETFGLIAKECGKNSQERKRDHIKRLLSAAIDCEPQYLIRLVLGNLRVGLGEPTLRDALAQAEAYYRHSSSSSSPSDHVVEKGSRRCEFIKPMLAKKTGGVSEVLGKFQEVEFVCEYKYDGVRAQIHYHVEEEGGGAVVEIFSRSGRRTTGEFPDVVAAVSELKNSHVSSFVLDCELVAYDRLKKKMLPLSEVARKDNMVFAFDMLYVNGESLLEKPLSFRREQLHKSFDQKPGYLQFATSLTSSNDIVEIQKFLDASVNSGCEGLMIKALDATYEPSKRSNKWLKLKIDFVGGIGDSLDLVPIGAFYGRGKRTGVYGTFLLACYDDNNEEYQSICEIGSGLSQKMLEECCSILRSKVIPHPKAYYRYGKASTPDVWFEPSEVWEVKAAKLTMSPVHCAAKGIVDSDKGVSLRSPIFLRVRKDKSPEMATSSELIAEMYSSQI